jgi:hypothetical protein
VAWLFYGDCSNLVLRITGSGMSSMDAIGEQDCRPSAGDFGVIELVKGLEGIWAIHAEEIYTGTFEPGPMSLRQPFARNRGRSCAEIHYFGDSDGKRAVVNATVLMLPAVMERTINLAKTLYAQPNVRYRLSLSFEGFAKSKRNDIQPSFDEFAQGHWGKPYLSEDVTFSIMKHSE